MSKKQAPVGAADAANELNKTDMRTRGWHRRFGQQYVALLYKNGETEESNRQKHQHHVHLDRSRLDF